MLAAYGDVRTRKCEACNRLLDKQSQFAVVRERRPSAKATDEKSSSAEPGKTPHAALHAGCRTTLLP